LDAHGEALVHQLSENGVDTSFVVRSPRPTAIARVTTSFGEEPRYAFAIDGTADRSLEIDQVPGRLPDTIQALHFGSYSLALDPTASTLETLMAREADRRIISLDPNVRPALLPCKRTYRESFERWISFAHIVKLSTADFAWIYPEADLNMIVQNWLRTRTRLVVLTCGANGATAFTRAATHHMLGVAVVVRDTVGAGDSFMAALLAALAERGRLSMASIDRLSETDIGFALCLATKAAAITCSRAGADPPRRQDIT